MAILLIFSLLMPALGGTWEDAKVAFDKKDYKAALKLLLPLAEQDDTDAQFDVGWIYGLEIDAKDVAEGIRWWRHAATQGHGNAQCFLGMNFWSGTGVEKNKTVGLMWMLIGPKKAARCKEPAKFHMRFMTIQQIEEAESMARDRLAEHPQ